MCEDTSDLVFVLRKSECREPLVNAVLVPFEDVFVVVGDVHGHDNESRRNNSMIQITCILVHSPSWTILGPLNLRTHGIGMQQQTQNPNQLTPTSPAMSGTRPGSTTRFWTSGTRKAQWYDIHAHLHYSSCLSQKCSPRNC